MKEEVGNAKKGMQGRKEQLMENPINDKQREIGRIIKHSANNLLVINNDILDLSKIKAGKLTLEKIDFKLTETSDNIKALFRHKLDKKKLNLEVQSDDDIPPVLPGDPYPLNQVLDNLLGNSLQFTQSTTIHIY